MTGETRVNGSLLLTKGIVRQADPIQAPPVNPANHVQEEPTKSEPASSL